MNDTELIETLCDLLSRAAETIKEQRRIIAMLKDDEEYDSGTDRGLLEKIETLVG